MADKYRKTMWGGFIGGKLDMVDVDDSWGGDVHIRKSPAIFTAYHLARRQYEDVRKVEIVEL